MGPWLLRQERLRANGHTDCIAHGDLSAGKNPGRDAPMSSHGVVSTDAQICLHLGAWVTRSGGHQNDFLADGDAQSLVREQGAGCDQVKARNHEIATKLSGGYAFAPDPRCNQGQMLRLNQRHLPLVATCVGRCGFGTAVAFQASALKCQDGRNGNQRRATGGTQQDGLHTARPRELPGELA